MQSTIRIRKISIHQAARFTAFLYLLFGLVAAAGLLFGLFAERTVTLSTICGSYQPGKVMAPLVPLLSAGCGYINGAIVACLFNMLSRFTGGIEIEIVSASEGMTTKSVEPAQQRG